MAFDHFLFGLLAYYLFLGAFYKGGLTLAVVCDLNFNLTFVSCYFYNLFVAVLGLRCCTGFSLVGGSGGYSLVEVHRLLIAVASLAVDTGCRASGLQYLGLLGSRAQAQ